MFLLSSFMASIYSRISIETGLVTHFSGYKIITFHLKGMVYVLNDDFRFFAYWNITKFCRSIDFALLNLIYQRNLLQLFILFILRNRHKNFYCIYLLKESFLQMAFKIFLGFKIYPHLKKLLRGHRAIVSYLVLQSPQFQTREGNFILYP